MNQAKGTLIPIGGAEDKGTDLEAGIIERNRLNFFELGILKSVVNEIGKENPKIVLLTTASSIPEEVSQNYFDAFAKLNCNRIEHISVRNREDADTEIALQHLQDCDAVMFSGGNQMRLTAIFGGTEFLKLLTIRYKEEKGFVIAGTSAGAMAMSSTMIYEGNAKTAHLKGEVKLTTGLGFINNVIIDSHFYNRGRFSRLAQAVATNPQAIGVGLGEDTGVIIRSDKVIEAIGAGAVMLIDGHNIKHSNIADISQGEPISVENITIHIMERGNKYNLSTRVFSAEVNELV